MRRWLLLLPSLLLVAVLGAATTTVSAATYTYDGPTVARVGAQAIDNAGATPFEV
jgi:hypothetical protein